MFLLMCVFFYGFWFVSFFPILVVILGLSFFDCSVLNLFFVLLHVLVARLSVWVFWAAFLWEPSRGVVWVWPTGGRGQYIFDFSHNRGVWVKTGVVPQVRIFANLFCFKYVHLRDQTDGRFQFCHRKRYNNRGFKNFLFKKKWSTTIYVCRLATYIFLTRKFPAVRVWGVLKKRVLRHRNTTKIGFQGL